LLIDITLCYVLNYVNLIDYDKTEWEITIMTNKPRVWQLGDKMCRDEIWIAYFNPSTNHIEYFEHSMSGKTIYSIGYANFCLNQYACMYPDLKFWIEPAYRVLS